VFSKRSNEVFILKIVVENPNAVQPLLAFFLGSTNIYFNPSAVRLFNIVKK